MARPLSVLLTLCALLLGLFAGLPGGHRCALAEQAAAELRENEHACCPKGAPEAADDGPMLCEGDCCGPDGELALVAPNTPPEPPDVFTVEPAPTEGVSLPKIRAARMLAATRPRGPPPDGPRAAPWLRNRALLL